MTERGTNERLLIVGRPEKFHLGAHLVRAAEGLGIAVQVADITEASVPVRGVDRVSDLLLHHPPRMASFSRAVVKRAKQWGATTVLGTGNVPLNAWAIRQLRKLGVRTVNFSTDDPWNPIYSRRWLFESFAAYDTVFTPRHVNMADFYAVGCRDVRHLPFGYDAWLHTPPPAGEFEYDVVFIGGADPDRMPFGRALIDSPHRVGLFGGYWDRDRSTRAQWGGLLSADEVRTTLGKSRLSICLVRRANRDTHVMRTFEEPAMGACMVFEDTVDHRALFGSELADTVGFQSPGQMLERVDRLLADEPLRQSVARRQRAAVVEGAHSYSDRLAFMLGLQAVAKVRPGDGVQAAVGSS